MESCIHTSYNALRLLLTLDFVVVVVGCHVVSARKSWSINGQENWERPEVETNREERDKRKGFRRKLERVGCDGVVKKKR